MGVDEKNSEGMDYLFDNGMDVYSKLMQVLNGLRSEQEDGSAAYKGELLLGKLREHEGKKLLQSNMIADSYTTQKNENCQPKKRYEKKKVVQYH